MSRWRGVSCVCIAFAAILARFAARPLRRRPSLREQLGRHAAAEEPAARRERHALAGIAAAHPRREPELLEPADRREIDCALEPAERERLVEPQPEEDALASLDGRRERLQLPRRRLATTQGGEVDREAWRRAPAATPDGRDSADPDPEVVPSAPVREVVPGPEIAAFCVLRVDAEVRGLVPAVAGAGDPSDDALEVVLHRLRLAGKLIPVGMCEASPGLRLELVAGEMLRLERERVAQVALEVGGALARDPIEEIQ